MKKSLLFLLLPALLFLTSCSKTTEVPSQPVDINQWMQSREAGRVAEIDYFSGNYMVQTNRGYSVIEAWGATPRIGDEVYGHFSFRTTQQIFNRSGNYFTTGRVHDYWLSYFQAIQLMQSLRL